jgi:AcrR family transcriptional regulator
MTTPRRVGAETSKTRALLLERAERLMLDEGYAAVTYRGLAARAGVTSGLVQYYFPTLDDLFVALVQRRTEETVGTLVGALQTDQPLRALWEFSNNRYAAALIAELTALANHRKAIRAEIAAVGEKVRELTLEALAKSSNDYTRPLGSVSVEVLVFLMTSTPRMIHIEEAVGMTASHAEAADFLEHYLDEVEPRHTSPASPPATPETEQAEQDLPAAGGRFVSP